MQPLALTGTAKIVAALALGFGFGALLVYSRVAFRKTLMDQISFKDNTFGVVFLISLAVGVPLFYFASLCHVITPRFNEYALVSVTLGALLTGAGVALCGHVPATALASFASGRVYSLWVLLGMLAAFPAWRWAQPFAQDILAKGEAAFPAPAFPRVPETVTLYILPATCLILALFLRLVQVNAAPPPAAPPPGAAPASPAKPPVK